MCRRTLTGAAEGQKKLVTPARLSLLSLLLCTLTLLARALSRSLSFCGWRFLSLVASSPTPTAFLWLLRHTENAPAGYPGYAVFLSRRVYYPSNPVIAPPPVTAATATATAAPTRGGTAPCPAKKPNSTSRPASKQVRARERRLSGTTTRHIYSPCPYAAIPHPPQPTPPHPTLYSHPCNTP